MHTAIVGATNIDHLQDNVAFAERGPLDGDLLAEISRRFAEVRGGENYGRERMG